MNRVLCHLKTKPLCVGILLGLCFTANLTRGQGQTTATLSGTVHDASGAVLPGVSITAESPETGRTQESVSDDQGRYRVAGLPAGHYRVTASLPGFRKAVHDGIQLAVAQAATLDLSLQLGEIAEEVTVRGEAPLVDTTVSSVSGVINSTQMTELPLNGRDFTQLSLLETGTVNVRNTDQNVNKGFGTRVSVAGSRPDQTGYMLDGTDINSFLNFQAPGSAAGVVLGVDAIREFRVEVSNFSAEYGRSAGGVFNMISKSGTNEIHGTAFEFHRNDNLDARNFFAVGKPEFKRHQFGASLGGPIVKNRTFFFTNYEGLRQAKGLSFTSFVPDDNARRGFLPAAGGGLREVGVAATIRPVIEELYPRANGPAVLLAGAPIGVATYFSSGINDVSEDYWVFKVDHEFSDKNQFFARYNFDDGALIIPSALGNLTDQQVSRFQYLTLEESRTFSARLLNVLRFAYNRTLVRGDGVAAHPISVTFRRGLPLYLGSVNPGSGITGSGGRDPRGGVQNLFQYTDNVYYTRGSHSLKFGFNFERVQDNDDTSRLGSWSFANLESFLRGIPQSISQAQFPGSDGIRGWRENYIGTYLQDDWRASSKLTFNLGVRWEFNTVPTEVNGKLAQLRNVVLDKDVTIGDPFWKNPSLKNIAPRMGLAWDPRGDGKTVVRAGYGLFFHLVIPPHYRINGARNPPFFNFADFTNPAPETFPYVDEAAAREIALGRGNLLSTRQANQFNPNSSYEQKFNLTMSREISGDTVLTVGYLGGRGVHLVNQTEINRPVSVLVNGRWVIPVGAVRRNPNVGEILYTKTDTGSFYSGLQVKLDRRLSAGLQARASYTFSKTTDDGTTASALTDFGEQGFSQNPDDPRAEHGLSKLDSRHSLTVSWVYELAAGRGLAGMGRTLLGGWMLNGIVSLSSGTPFGVNLGNFDNTGTITRFTLVRPDLAPGANSNPIREDNPVQYFDPSVFIVPPARTYGNLGRNTLRGPGYANLDLGLTKTTALSKVRENLTLQFRVELFNVLNRAQFGLPSQLSIFTNRTTRLATTGRITNTVADGRDIQVGLKLVW
ncbi:MAG: TonB-dependent receptor [Acidobacteria bacterium]|nr:TonB-dependent receptor [Acidobacteriota bacterium]